MKIDLHVHTKERSSCGASSEEEQIRTAIDTGLDAIAFSDHDRLAPLERLRELNDKYVPFRIFSGIEVSVWNKRFLASEHLLVLGIHDAALENRDWTYPALHQFVRESGGFIALAHPFRFSPTIGIALERFPPDALEAYSNNISGNSERICSLAQQLGVNILSNSDAHHTNFLGQYYNALERTPANEQELVEILKSGQFTCMSPEHAYKLTY